MRFLLSICFLFIGYGLQAQNIKSFEGEITFELQIHGGGEEMELARHFMPTGFLYVLKANNVLVKTLGPNSAMTGNVVFNEKTNQAFLVQEAAKMVYLFKEDANSFETSEDVGQVPLVSAGSEAKTIGGYKCNHYIITHPQDEGGHTEIWVSEDIMMKMPAVLGNNMPIDQKMLSTVKGFPLAMKMDGPNGLKISMTATEIVKKPIHNRQFEIPKGYEVKNFEPGQVFPGGGR